MGKKNAGAGARKKQAHEGGTTAGVIVDEDEDEEEELEISDHTEATEELLTKTNSIAPGVSNPAEVVEEKPETVFIGEFLDTLLLFAATEIRRDEATKRVANAMEILRNACGRSSKGKRRFEAAILRMKNLNGALQSALMVLGQELLK